MIQGSASLHSDFAKTFQKQLKYIRPGNLLSQTICKQRFFNMSHEAVFTLHSLNVEGALIPLMIV